MIAQVASTDSVRMNLHGSMQARPAHARLPYGVSLALCVVVFWDWEFGVPRPVKAEHGT